MRQAGIDAGFTLLEVLVVLAILAAMTVVLAGSIRQAPVASLKSATPEASVASVRYSAVLSGVPQLLTVDSGTLSPEVREALTNLSGDLGHSSDSGLADDGNVTVVAYPDGGLATIGATDGANVSSALQLSATP